MKKVIGWAIDDFDTAPQIVDGVMRWAEHANWELIDLRSWRGEIPCETKIDGLIYNANNHDGEKLQHLLRVIPFSVQIHPSRQFKASNRIDVDLTAVGLQAAEYYLDRGFRNFALAAYRTDEWIQSLRVFKKRIEQAGGQCQAIHGLHLPDAQMKDVRNAVRMQLRGLSTPLGIFCANDRLAVRLCRWCIEEGIAVPEQAAILGYGNSSTICKSNPVPLSSVNPNFEQHGFEAARLLQRVMDGESLAQGTVILIPPGKIVTRRSTDITAIQDARVARALRYVWDHYQKNIGPDDVAVFCGIPRRSLDRHFKLALGRTVMREVMRQRLEKACEMLTGSEMSVVDIAAQAGFRSPQYFNFQFKKHVGTTPQRFRNQSTATPTT